MSLYSQMLQAERCLPWVPAPCLWLSSETGRNAKAAAGRGSEGRQVLQFPGIAARWGAVCGIQETFLPWLQHRKCSLSNMLRSSVLPWLPPTLLKRACGEAPKRLALESVRESIIRDFCMCSHGGSCHGIKKQAKSIESKSKTHCLDMLAGSDAAVIHGCGPLQGVDGSHCDAKRFSDPCHRARGTQAPILPSPLPKF